jgi:hypothetical protein
MTVVLTVEDVLGRFRRDEEVPGPWGEAQHLANTAEMLCIDHVDPYAMDPGPIENPDELFGALREILRLERAVLAAKRFYEGRASQEVRDQARAMLEEWKKRHCQGLARRARTAGA